MSGDETLDLILHEFPDLEGKIVELYHESSNFIEICEDYALCLNSILHVKSMKEAGYEEKLGPLQGALSDLKEELILIIER